jgi:hypothetical protein
VDQDRSVKRVAYDVPEAELVMASSRTE